MTALIFCTFGISRDLISVFSGSGNSAPTSEYLPDRPIGYGAFGVVWSVTDPRDSKRVALKKLPNVFQSLVSSKRVFRELKMMRFFRHENVLSCLDILQVSIMNIFLKICLWKNLSKKLSNGRVRILYFAILRDFIYFSRWFSKGQLDSEWINEVIIFPKMQT